MFDKTLLDDLDHTPQPEYILLNQAIDIAMQNIERPYYLFFYPTLADVFSLNETLINFHVDPLDKFDGELELDISRRCCINKISQSYITGNLPLYLSSISVFRTKQFINRKTKEANNIDYPVWKFDKEKKKIENLFKPHQSKNIKETFHFIAPSDYNQVNNLLEGSEHFIKNESDYVYECTINSIRRIAWKNLKNKKHTPCLLFVKTSNIKRLFPQKSTKLDEKRGRSKNYTELESFIAYLKSNDIDLSCFDNEKSDSFTAMLQEKGDFGGDRTIKKHHSLIKKAIEKVDAKIKERK